MPNWNWDCLERAVGLAQTPQSMIVFRVESDLTQESKQFIHIALRGYNYFTQGSWGSPQLNDFSRKTVQHYLLSSFARPRDRPSEIVQNSSNSKVRDCSEPTFCTLHVISFIVVAVARDPHPHLTWSMSLFFTAMHLLSLSFLSLHTVPPSFSSISFAILAYNQACPLLNCGFPII